jgi:hypothetical protein
MDTIAYRDAVIEFDRDATHAEYAKLRRGAADECHCEACQNFIAARDAGLVYPNEANDLLAALGTDLGKEWELCDFAEPTREPHMYSGRSTSSGAWYRAKDPHSTSRLTFGCA